MIVNKSDIIKKLRAMNNSTINESIDINKIKKNLSIYKKENNVDAVIKNVLDKKPMVESTWFPRPTHITKLVNKVLTESSDQPNAFRLDLKTIVIDKTHAKFKLTRNGISIAVDIVYPNANNNITIKLSTEGSDDLLREIGLEDKEYAVDFGAFIIKLADELIKSLPKNTNDSYGVYNVGDNLGGVASAWDSNGIKGSGTIWESDFRKMQSLMTLIEEEEEPTDGMDEADDIPDDIGGDMGAGDVNSEFGADDFSLDTGDTSFGDFGGSSDFGGGDVNSDQSDSNGLPEVDVNYMKFNDKSDWLQSSLDAMQSLIATATASAMQDGSGVIMTSDEILNGTKGLKTDMPIDIVKKFLKIYPELDGIDLKEEDMQQIEEKLSVNDGQFDSWLQSKLPEFIGQSDVDDALNNDMFNDDFESMGGDPMFDDSDDGDETPELDFSDDTEVNFDDLIAEVEAGEGGTEKNDFAKAEMEMDDKKLDEFQNI